MAPRDMYTSFTGGELRRPRSTGLPWVGPACLSLPYLGRVKEFPHPDWAPGIWAWRASRRGWSSLPTVRGKRARGGCCSAMLWPLAQEADRVHSQIPSQAAAPRPGREVRAGGPANGALGL